MFAEMASASATDAEDVEVPSKKIVAHANALLILE
jgi:hypothetical protein